MERLSAVLGQAVQFVYACWDRIVLNGYLERLQRPECLVHFFHDVVGISCIEPAVLEHRTSAYKAWGVGSQMSKASLCCRRRAVCAGGAGRALLSALEGR